MPSIKLIVTGDLERAALAESLKRFFPAVMSGAPPSDVVEWLRPMKVGATTTDPRTHMSSPTAGGMASMARALVTELENPRSNRVPAPDLIIAVDDLELANMDHLDVVVAHARAALDIEVERRFSSANAQDRLKEKLRDRCSFHFLCPMVEAYFFGDAPSLALLGVPEESPPRLTSGDVERFESDDPTWLPECRERNARLHALGKIWWREERHPKNYLQHLVSRTAPAAIYDEVEDGAPAFKDLDWHRVASAPHSALIARSLFQDLSDWFGVVNPLGAGATASQTYPPPTVRREQRILRNL